METPKNKTGHGRPLHIAYVGPVDFPSSSAPAQRMMGVIQALNAAGDRVSVGSAGYQKNDAVMAGDVRMEVSALGELPDPNWNKLRRVLRGLMWGAATRNWIQQLDPAPDVILMYGATLGYLVRLIPIARRRRIPLVIDATEWYEPSHLPGGKWGPFALANSLSMRNVVTKADGALAISRFLEDYLAERGVATLRVPPLFTVSKNSDGPVRPDRPLTLCYVGTPGPKDRHVIYNLVNLPGALGCVPDQLRVHIVGIEKMGVVALLGDSVMSAVQNESLIFHGRLPSLEARKIITESHFSVLQRGSQRYAEAGFPSKVPESLLLGTPVMANLTSDLSDVLVEGMNSIILPDASLDALVSKVSLVLASDYDFDADVIAEQARSLFGPLVYSDKIHAFLQEVRSSVNK